MKAMILAAGLGTRLRPLTDNRPKALVEVGGRTLLEITLTRLRAFGVSEAIVNVHHFAPMVIEYLQSQQKFGMRIEISREEVLLDTGGGLKKAAWFFLEDAASADVPFILHNVDVISTIDLAAMLRWHNEHGALATLAVQDRPTSRYLLFNDRDQLCGRHSSKEAKARTTQDGNDAEAAQISGCLQPKALAFSGIHVISRRFLAMMTEQGAFSIIDAYLRLAGQGERILRFRADDFYWRDLGKPENVAQAAEDIERKLVQI